MQVALVWLLAQGDDIAPIPGTKRVSRVEEHTAADRIELTGEQIKRLNDIDPATGERHNEANMPVAEPEQSSRRSDRGFESDGRDCR